MLTKSLITFALVAVQMLLIEITAYAQSDGSLLTIHQNKIVGKVNKGLFGNNLYVDSPSQKGGLYENYGGGIWDPEQYKPDSKLVAISKELGITSFRWPGGNRARSFDWKTSVGPVANRKFQQFGLPEFLYFCEITNATPIITLSALKHAPEYLADLVEYLNATADGSNPNGGIDWALLRKKDGRELPWGVKWFEYGNETYNTNITVESYVNQYKNSQYKMKLVDPTIKLGVVFEGSNNIEDGWTYSVLKSLASKADFGIIHIYHPFLDSIARDKVSPGTVALAAVSSDADIADRLNHYERVISEFTSVSDFPLVVSEYNGHYPHNKPVAYRFTLVNSLRNADMLRVLMNPKYNIKMANYWLFVNAHWGLLFNNEKRKKTVKQSDALMFTLFRKYLGDDMLGNEMITSSFEFPGAIGISPRVGLADDNNGDEIPLKYKNEAWKTKYFFNGKQENDNNIVKVNFNKNLDVNYYHAYKTVDVEPDTLYRVKVQIKTESIKGGKVGIIVEDSRGWKKTYHQASNLQLSGTSKGWVTVTTEYHTLSDAKKISIVARRIGGKGEISGNVDFGAVDITKVVQKYGAVPSVTAIATKNISDRNIYALLINKNLYDPVIQTIFLKGQSEYKLHRSETLSGDSPFSTNYNVDEPGVRLNKLIVKQTSNNKFTVKLPPASITGIQFVEHQAY